jgi:galactokinase/mevalonate kinase-like predicted kinase
MDDELFEQYAEMNWVNRARLDVLERAVAIFMANTNRRVAEVIEDQFRGYIEKGITSADPAEAEKLRLADEAAVRFADVLAQALAKRRG